VLDAYEAAGLPEFVARLIPQGAELSGDPGEVATPLSMLCHARLRRGHEDQRPSPHPGTRIADWPSTIVDTFEAISKLERTARPPLAMKVV
jgi:hypothetical protein